VSHRILTFVNHVPPTADPLPGIDRAFEWGVDIVIAQGNGMDFGPYWLGSGEQFPVRNLANNVRPYLVRCHEHGVPFVLSVGIAGADVHLEACLGAIDDVCREEGLDIEIAVVSGEIDKQYLKDRLAAGTAVEKLVEHSPVPSPLTAEDVDRCARIVSQMGPEPIAAALETGAAGVVTGRALDVGLFMGPLLRAGIPHSVAAHAGKILECGGLVLSPGDAGMPVYAEVDEDGLVIRSPSDDFRVEARNIAAHCFYERRDPFREENPGGFLDLEHAAYEQLDSHAVRASGAGWGETPYFVKLEGAAPAGHRCMNLSSIRDPRLLAELDGVLERVRRDIVEAPRFSHLGEGVDYHLTFTVYGRGVVPGPPIDPATVPEVGVVIDVVAPTEDLAREICYFAYIGLWIKPYPGRKTSAGNNAQRYTPPIVDMGIAYRWGVWHLLPLDDPCEPFRMDVRQFPLEMADALA
jgi:hypothetical protein